MKLRFIAFTALLLMFSCKPKEVEWVALGDSITYLNDHPDETGDRITKGYMTLVTEHLPHITYINRGFNGWKSVDIARRFGELDVPPADVYTVFLGTNDWWHGVPVGTFEDYKENRGPETVYGAFRVITDNLRTLNPSAEIILITPMQRGDFVYINNPHNNAYGSYREKNGQMLSDVVDAVKAIGGYEDLKVIDLYNDSGITQENMVAFKRLKDSEGNYRDYGYPDFVDVPFDPDNDDYPYPVEAIDMTYDGLHPSDKGYRAIATMVVDAIKSYRK